MITLKDKVKNATKGKGLGQSASRLASFFKRPEAKKDEKKEEKKESPRKAFHADRKKLGAVEKKSRPVSGGTMVGTAIPRGTGTRMED